MPRSASILCKRPFSGGEACNTFIERVELRSLTSIENLKSRSLKSAIRPIPTPRHQYCIYVSCYRASGGKCQADSRRLVCFRRCAARSFRSPDVQCPPKTCLPGHPNLNPPANPREESRYRMASQLVQSYLPSPTIRLVR